MKMRFVILNFLFIIMWSCSPTDSVFKDQEITLEVDAEVIENWIALRAEPVKTTFIYTVKRDTAIIFEGQLDQNDTLIHDENLDPACTYTYTAFAQKGKEKSKTVTAMATTMDTTSHDFTWESFEWGGRGSSILFDVAIISPDDIWAVGEIHTEDTDKWNEDSTEWITAYNAVHWDGIDWELMRIKTNACGGVVHPPIEAVLSFSEDDVLFGHKDGSITFYNGSAFTNDCKLIQQLNGSVTKMWGISKNDLYVVSSNGFIAHYDGQNWTKIESGVTENINDIWGSVAENAGKPYILLPLSFKWDLGDKILLQLQPDNTTIEENWPFSDRRLNSVWFVDQDRVFVSGAGVFTRDRLEDWKEYTEIPLIFTDRVRGTNINDIFVTGDFGILAHFNGKTWKEYTEFNEVDIFRGLAFKDDIAIAVGENNSKAVIYMINR